MKKFFFTLVVMAVFAIGFVASDDDGSLSSSSSQTEQKQETPAEKEAREKQEKNKKIADMAYQKGWDARMNSNQVVNPANLAGMEYAMRYGREPEDEGEEERWKIFVKNYIKGYNGACKKLYDNFY